MRILILTDLYPPHFLGGYELKCKLQAEELARRGHEVYVLTSRWKAGNGAIEGNVYRQLYFSPLDENLYTGSIPSDLLRLRKRYNQLKWAFECRENYRTTLAILTALQPNLVFVWNMHSIGISPVVAAQKLRIPMVFRLLDYWLADFKYNVSLQSNLMKKKSQAAILGLQDWARLDLCHLLVVSRAVMQKHIELGFPEERFTVIPEGVPSNIILDPADLAKLSWNRDHIRLVHVGRLVQEKGTHIAIQALAMLVKKMGICNVHLDIIGTGPSGYVQQLKNMVTCSGLENQVTFVGFLEPRQVLDRFMEYNAVLIPSLWAEPLSNTIAEAMARGLPVIATDRGGTAEIISDNENGLLVLPDDPTMLANAIRKLVQDPLLVQKIRLAALDTVRERYTHERVADQIEAYLQRVVHQSAAIAVQGKLGCAY